MTYAIGKPWTDIGDNVQRHGRRAGMLYKLTVAYFVLPCLIFLLTFTEWYVAVLAGIPLLAAVAFDYRFERGLSREAPVTRDGRLSLLLVVALAFCWTALFGAGFVGAQSGDQLKNHMIFKDLITLPWPVVFDAMPAEFRFLSYPLGFYLTPSLIAKGLGWSHGMLAIYIWSACGIALLWSWFTVFFGRYVWLAIAVFVLFSGLDMVGMVAMGHGTPLAGSHVEWWSDWTFLQYSSNATVMSWSMQHGAAQWLLPTLMFYRLVGRKTVRGATLMLATAAFWSHLTLLGILAFLPLVLRSRERIAKAFQDPTLLALPFFFVIVLFYASKAPGAIEAGALWNLWPADWFLPRLMWFCLLEFGVLALFIYATRSFRDADESLLFTSAVIILLLTPLYHIGWSNDVSMRVSAIPLFVLYLFFVSALMQAWQLQSKPVVAMAVAYIAVAAFTPVNEMFRHLSLMKAQTFFTARLFDEKWDRGVSRKEPNCLLTTIPRHFEVRVGDEIDIAKNGKLPITRVWIEGLYQGVCVPEGVTIKQGPARDAWLRLRFYRDGKRLRDKFVLRFRPPPEAIASIVTVWPGQYTGSQQSLFYRRLLKRDDR
ncbi:hypothetical protein K6V92_20980 [Cupriavidus respiraculi]|uniref:hypothetical protein n=1 Tax=Cupriavidus respiraculi TaxID=195930 RepID=UPI001C94C362|nr:hypothetical protein [Cupriavidus respiraculi]MBY4949079.1 hypothetical protein [Cupriavidus respiraculi]